MRWFRPKADVNSKLEVFEFDAKDVEQFFWTSKLSGDKYDKAEMTTYMTCEISGVDQSFKGLKKDDNGDVVGPASGQYVARGKA